MRDKLGRADWKGLIGSRQKGWERTLVLCILGMAPKLPAADLMIHLPKTSTVSRQTILYRCDTVGQTIGVPAGPFPVEYIDGGGNSLVVVPVAFNKIIFSNVSSASGARYTAQQYTWWDAKGVVTLYADSMNGKLKSSCHRVQHE